MPAHELVSIPAGFFTMGSPDDEWGRDNDECPQRRVVVGSFYLSRYPVTVADYERYLSAVPSAARPATLADARFNHPNQPIVGVTWAEACAFASWAGGRLPNEAEWEYACRAGSTTSTYAGELSGDDDAKLDAIAWYRRNSQGKPQPVGAKTPNEWGLHDMLGNVWEWCADWYSAYPPVGSADAHSERVVRGGSWLNTARYARAARRDEWPPTLPDERIGFRLATDTLGQR